MKNDVDTLSYMMGISNTQGLKEYAMNQLGIDSAHFADFVKGIEQGTKSTDPKNVAYTAGMQIGQLDSLLHWMTRLWQASTLQACM